MQLNPEILATSTFLSPRINDLSFWNNNTLNKIYALKISYKVVRNF